MHIFEPYCTCAGSENAVDTVMYFMWQMQKMWITKGSWITLFYKPTRKYLYLLLKALGNNSSLGVSDSLLKFIGHVFFSLIFYQAVFTSSLRCMFSSKSRTPIMPLRQSARQPTKPIWQLKKGSPIISTWNKDKNIFWIMNTVEL